MTMQRQTHHGDDVDPTHLPDAPVLWERSDVRSMRPVEAGDQRVIEEGDPAQPAQGGVVTEQHDDGRRPAVRAGATGAEQAPVEDRMRTAEQLTMTESELGLPRGYPARLAGESLPPPYPKDVPETPRPETRTPIDPDTPIPDTSPEPRDRIAVRDMPDLPEEPTERSTDADGEPVQPTSEEIGAMTKPI